MDRILLLSGLILLVTTLLDGTIHTENASVHTNPDWCCNLYEILIVSNVAAHSPENRILIALLTFPKKLYWWLIDPYHTIDNYVCIYKSSQIIFCTLKIYNAL